MRTYAEYKEMYPDKTDAQIIELLDWELGEKVQEIGRLLLELNANKDGWVSVEEVLSDFTPKVYELFSDPLFRLEHSQHGMACEKFQEIRNKFINDRK